MQKVLVRKLRIESGRNDTDFRTGVIISSKECATLENSIQNEINDGWKVTNVSSSYDAGWHCNVVVFVLEKDVMEEEDKKY